MIILFLPFLLSSWFLFYKLHKEVIINFSQVLRIENPKDCSKSLKEFFLEDKVEECFPPASDHIRNQEKNGAREVVCLLLLESDVQWKGIKCPFH